jgi:hypothetical protein
MSSDMQTTLAGIAIALSAAGAIVTAWNHKRIRSVCCQRVFSASLDIESTTPPLRSQAPPAPAPPPPILTPVVPSTA